MYTINNIPISTYGLYPARAPGSNIALSGHLDLNKRAGKTYHDWSEEEGVEPYVSALDLAQGYEPKQVQLFAYVKGVTRAAVVQQLEQLYQDLSLLGVFTLGSPWGNVSGYVKEKIIVDWLGPHAANVRITMDGVAPFYADDDVRAPSFRELHHIDNKELGDYGAKVVGVENNFNRPETKEPFHTNYAQPWQVTKPGYKEFELEMVFHAPTYALMANAIGNFHYELMREDTRVMNVDGLDRECFNIEGTEISNIQVHEGLACCTLKMPMALAYDGIPVDTKYLDDPEVIQITTPDGKFISVD